MTEDRDKSLKEKKLEGILGMGDSLKKLDEEEAVQTNKNDEEKKQRMEERKKFLQEHKEQFDIVRKKPDIEFSRDIYKELIMTDMEILRIVRKEIEMDPSPRAVETAASLTSSITSTIDSLRDIDEVKVDQGFEREKIDMKKNQGNMGPGAGVVMIGSMSDILAKIKSETVKTIETTATVVEKVEDKKG